jgi:23S rRNA (uracil1939-C5)-methyltransferase
MSHPSSPPPQEVIVEVTALASGGSCVGSIVSPYTIPGERVGARVLQNKKSFVNGELVSIQRSAPERRAPACPAFRQCGGCDLQHIELDAQRRFKASMVEDLLKVHGGVVARDGVTLLGPDLPGFEYRRRMSFHINKKCEFGLYRKNGRQIVQITHCPISTPAINLFLERNLDLIKGCAPEIETVTVEDHDGHIFVAFEVHPKNDSALVSLLPKAEFKELEARLGTIQVNYRHKPIYRGIGLASDAPPVGHFSQNNARANALMVEYLVSHVRTDKVTDLYAGAGNISIPLAQAGRTVTAVEVDPQLVAFGKARAASAGVTDRLTFHTKSCEKWVEKSTPDATVVLDPPRGGALEVCQRLSAEISPSLLYVSCYPPTFARDTQILQERGYQLVEVKVLDMFPQTYHSETVATFERHKQ